MIGFNSQLYVKDISLLDSETKWSFTDFIDGLQSGNGTGLYYADYTALKKMNEYTKPSKLKNVALVTFTDGLDNVSTATSETDPENYGSTSAYREALHNKIVNEKIHGFSLSAYTIGLKGNDVSDEAQFNETLRKLASNDNNVFQVANMNEAMQRLSEIAENLYSVSTTVNLGVDVPGGYDDGQMLRFTFDNVSAASSSQRYIEARYKRNGNSRTLDNITYVGFTQGQSSISSSSVQGVYYHFQISDLTYANGNPISQTDINRIQLWKQTSNGAWDKETEFDPASSSTVTEDKSSALIMLVLDCTNSLGSDFNKMQQGGKGFVEVLANSNAGGGSGGLYETSRTVYFNLQDSYGDGWNGASLTIMFDDGTESQELSMSSGYSKQYEFEINKGTQVSVVFNGGDYNSECYFNIGYENEIIYSCSQGDLVYASGQQIATFTVW